MKKCPGCGSIYEDTQKFCSECGSPLVEVTEEVPAVPAEPEKVEEPSGTMSTRGAIGAKSQLPLTR